MVLPVAAGGQQCSGDFPGAPRVWSPGRSRGSSAGRRHPDRGSGFSGRSSRRADARPGWFCPRPNSHTARRLWSQFLSTGEKSLPFARGNSSVPSENRAFSTELGMAGFRLSCAPGQFRAHCVAYLRGSAGIQCRIVPKITAIPLVLAIVGEGGRIGDNPASGGMKARRIRPRMVSGWQPRRLCSSLADFIRCNR